MAYLESLHAAKAQLDGIEHDPAAAMARAMWAAQQVGYCHVYDPAERIDYLWNESGTTWKIRRGDRVMETWFVDHIRAKVASWIANA